MPITTTILPDLKELRWSDGLETNAEAGTCMQHHARGTFFHCLQVVRRVALRTRTIKDLAASARALLSAHRSAVAISIPHEGMHRHAPVQAVPWISRYATKATSSALSLS